MVTRIGMMLPGAVSLGAYEGGALAAVLTAVQASEGELVIDAIASASAGSMTALVAARALSRGTNPIKLLQATWVNLPSLENLEKDKNLQAPLSMTTLIEGAQNLLRQGVEGEADDPGKIQTGVPVRLSMALTVLGGLTYVLPRPPSDPAGAVETLRATTYLDWYKATVEPDCPPELFIAHLEGAMASGSTPVGFPPKWVTRDDVTNRDYANDGILLPQGSPPDAHPAFWYSDGGDIDNQPLGRLLDLIEDSRVAEPDSVNDDRVIVMLNIEPAPPPTFSGIWFDHSPEPPAWLTTLLHVNHIRSTQSLYDDLKTLEKTNQRIRWINEVADALGEANFTDDGVQHVAQRVADRRTELRTTIHDQAGQRLSDGAADTPAAAKPAENLKDLLLQAAGLVDKREVRVEVISPKIDPTVTLTPDQQLSGEFLYHFGGFFDVDFRRSDFALGYHDAQVWLEDWLPSKLTGAQLEAVLAAVTEGAKTDIPQVDLGTASLSKLPLMEKVKAVDLLGHVGHVIISDLAADVAHKEGSVVTKVLDHFERH